MKHILSVLRGIDSVLPILALRSLFPSWEGEFTIEPGFCVVKNGDEPDKQRELRLTNQDSPLISTTLTGNSMRIALDTSQECPPELSKVLMAAGLVFRGNEGQLIVTNVHDTEALYERCLDLDHAWEIMRKLKQFSNDPDCLTSSAEKLFQLACDWNRNSSSIGRLGDKPRLLAECEQLEALASNCDSLNVPGLVSVELQPDYRGSALEVRFRDSASTMHVSASNLNWDVGTIRLVKQAPEKRVHGRYDVTPSRVPQDMIDVLCKARIDGYELKIVEQLVPARYAKVKAFLQDLGAQWSVSKQAHVFTEDPAPVIDAIIATGEVFTFRDFEFFETTPELTALVMSRSGIKPGMTVAEPNAGGGALAMAAAEIVGRENVICYELMPRNVAKLQALGFRLDGPTDFLKVEPIDLVDSIVMNPPFSGGRDAAHITHALRFVKPGGTLTAIASTQWQTHDTAPARKFQAFLNSLNASIEQIPAGAFKASGTDVPTTLIVIKKAAVAASLPPRRPAPKKREEEQTCLF